MIRHGCHALALAVVGLALTSCAKPERPALAPLPASLSPPGTGVAFPRINGRIGTSNALPPTQVVYGSGKSLTPPQPAAEAPGAGTISLDFADTDIREVVGQILGGMLRVNYAIDPAVHGNVTLRTTTPLSRMQLLPTLEALLSEVGATLVRTDALYRVEPIATATGTSAVATESTAGSTVLSLRYASAEELAKPLQPFAGTGKIAAEPGHNALLVSGEPSTRNALLALAQTFDVDMLAGQSYVLLPVSSGDAKDFATALQEAFRGQGGAALSGVVRVVPMERINAVLLISSQRHYVEAAQRVYAMLERARRQTVRGWRVYYLQNSPANDIAYILQQAFTPGNVTAQPSSVGQTAPGKATRRVGGLGGLGGGSNATSGSISASSLGSGSALAGGTASRDTTGAAGTTPQAGGVVPGASLAALNPLLGGLDQTAGGGDLNAMRIIPDPQNNAVLIYGTPQEEDTAEAMLHKIDVLPLQVRIDATIAEVTLNDALRYGTQFFFRSGGINGVLSNLSQDLSQGHLASAAFATTFPGFVIGGNGLSGAPLAISILQQVTSVHVLSSPELLVLDNHQARLEVGSLVPFLTQSAQSTLVNNAPIINSIDYHQTGVILDVVPRVNSGGLVTLDISQAVSDVDTNPPTAPGVAINSPTFLDRSVELRVVVQDGQTVGLAGMIRDNISHGNSGIPWLKDVPILGALAGTQDNQRTRTELLVLITPHVVHDQRDARALTQDMREQLFNAALVPQESQSLRLTGSSDPQARVLRKI